MSLWIFAFVLIAVTVLAVLWPLVMRRDGANRLDRDVAEFKAREAELQRQFEAGEISRRDYEGALAEQGRSLIARGRAANGSADDPGALARRKLAALAMLVGVPVLAVLLYLGLGAPAMRDLPLASRPTAPQNFDLAQALQKIEAHLAKNPDDGRGFEVVAPVYLRAGRFADAAIAYRRVVELLGESPARLADLGESLVAEANGVVNAEARRAFERAAVLEPGYPKARFYLALVLEQDGDGAGVFAALQALEQELGDGAARQRVSAEIERLRAEGKAPAGPGNAIAALPEAERAQVIRSMVEGLEARLAANGGSLEEWSRLVQARIVLGERPKAAAALEAARKALAGDPGATPVLEALEARIAAMKEGK